MWDPEEATARLCPECGQPLTEVWNAGNAAEPPGWRCPQGHWWSHPEAADAEE
jgi:hypothetical protein